MEYGVAVKMVILPAAILLFQSNDNNRQELGNDQTADKSGKTSNHLQKLASALTCALQAALVQHHGKF